MVRFEENKLIIEIEAPFPAETWTDLHIGIYDLVRDVKQETLHNASFYSVIDFLQELMPDYDTVKKMMSE